jgi:hypothetical protein
MRRRQRCDVGLGMGRGEANPSGGDRSQAAWSPSLALGSLSPSWLAIEGEVTTTMSLTTTDGATTAFET